MVIDSIDLRQQFKCVFDDRSHIMNKDHIYDADIPIVAVRRTRNVFRISH